MAAMSEPIDIKAKSSILAMTYDAIDCMSPGEADSWADKMFDIDYDSDRDLKQKLKLNVTKFKHEHGRPYEETKAKTSYKLVLEEEQKKRERLINQLESFEDSVKKLMSISRQSQRNQTMTKIHALTQKFQEEKKEVMKDFLTVKPNPIFITGETSSGKSSFINLLLSDNIMPVDFERSSSTFCVISKSPVPYKLAKVHFKDSSAETLTIDEREQGDKFNTECQKYLASRTSHIQFVELMTTSEILQDDVIIMDSPGMGDPEFAQDLRKKIQSACAFVYILKHFNPIGEDCQEIAEIVKNAIRGCRDQVDYDSMVFVINKWDTVQRDKQATLNSICRRLKKFMNGLSDERVIPMSVRDAIFMQNEGIRADDYNKFLKLLHTLQISSITNKTRQFHSTVVRYMTDILEALKLLEYKLNTHVEDRKKKANQLDQCRERIAAALTDYDERKQIQFNALAKERTRELIRRLKGTKNDRELRSLFKGLMSRVMPFAITPNEMDIQIAQFAAEKLSFILEAQEQKDRFFSTISEDLLREFFKKFNEFQETLQQQQRDLFSGCAVGVLGKEKSLVERAMPEWSRMSLRQKIIFGVSIPVYIPVFIGACVVSLNIKFLSMIKDAVSPSTQMLTIDGRREYVIKKSMQLFDRYSQNEDYINQYVKDNMKDVQDTLENLKKAAREQLENLRIDAKVLREDSDSDRQLIEEANLIRQRFKLYLSSLYQFEFECLQYEHVLSEVLFTYDNPNRPLTFSTNSAIYGVTMCPEVMGELDGEWGTPRASLRRIFWQVMADDAVPSLHKEIQLSTLCSSESPHLLRMVRVVKSPPHSESINVSLLCEPILCNLRTVVYEKTPRMDCAAKFFFLQERFLEISAALSFLHGYEVDFRDTRTNLTGFELNLDTIVMTAAGKVKLSSLKLAESVVIPHVVDCQDGVHSFRHIAAEVLLQKRPYNAAADMYSLAIAMYEAWFHTEAFLEYTFDRDNPKNTLKEFAEKLVNPAAVLEKQVERNGLMQRSDSRRSSDTKEQLQGPRQWFTGIRLIIEAYKKEDPSLMPSKWTSYLPTS